MKEGIVMSFTPKNAADILNGKKVYEIRNRFMKQYRGWIFLYCKKIYKYFLDKNESGYFVNSIESGTHNTYYEGKVVGKIYCGYVKQYKNGSPIHRKANIYNIYTQDNILERANMTEYDLLNYSPSLSFYAIKISRVIPFDHTQDIRVYGHLVAPQKFYYVKPRTFKDFPKRKPRTKKRKSKRKVE